MICVATLAITTALWFWVIANHHRNRAANLEEQNQRLNTTINEHYEATELVLEHMAALEKRNLWLEQRRHVVSQRWWRRSQHRSLSVWVIRRTA